MQKLTRGAQLIPTHQHHQFLFLYLIYWITRVCEPLCSIYTYTHLQEVNSKFKAAVILVVVLVVGWLTEILEPV